MTLKRIRAYASLIAVTMWAVWLIDFSNAGVIDRLGKIKGTDFIQFYVSGSFVREGRADLLYDVPAQLARLRSVAPGSPDTVYLPVQSPQTAMAIAPLTACSYPVAVIIWSALITVLYGAACWLTWRHCPALQRYRTETVACCAAFPGLFSTVTHGQISGVALLAVAAALLALRRQRMFTAGLALGCLVFKPHWAAVAVTIFTFAREWRVVSGAVLAAAGQVTLVGAALGSGILEAYGRTLQSLSRLSEFVEPRPGNTLQGLVSALVPWNTAALALYAVAAFLTLLVVARLWRGSEPFEIRATAIVLAMVLVSPHAFEYDLILLTPAFFFLANWIADRPETRANTVVPLALYGLFVAPLMLGLPALIRLQFSVTAMCVILFALARRSEPIQLPV